MIIDDGTNDPSCDCGEPAYACACDDMACGPFGCNGSCDSGRCWFDEVEDEWACEYEDAP